MNIEEIIRNKIKIYTKERFLEIFSKILIDKSTHFFISKKEKLFKEKNIKNYNPNTLWNYLTIVIIKKYGKSKIQYPDLIYNYLVKLCNKIFRQLIAIAISNKLNIRNLTDYYLDLCKKEIENLKNQKMKKIIKIKKPKNPLANESKSNRKKEKNKNSFYNSYANLFIGDVEENSVFQRYLSNILVLSSQKIFAHGSYVDFSKNYVKNFVNKMNYLSELSKQKDSRDLSISSIKLNLQKKRFKKYFERKITSYKDSKNVSNNDKFRKVTQKINKSSSMNDLFPSHYYNNNDSILFSNSRIHILKKPLKKVPKKNKIVKYFLSKSDFYYE